MIYMIGEPKFWRIFGIFSATTKEIIRDVRCECSEPGLSGSIAVPIVAAKARHEDGLMSREPQCGKEQLRDSTIT